MKFDVYYPFFSKKANKTLPGVKPVPMEWKDIVEKILQSPDVESLIMQHRNGMEGVKIALPSINFVGRSTSTRKASAMIPTQIVMVDIDHCVNPRAGWEKIVAEMTPEWINEHVMLAHLTPSLGIHIFFKALPDCQTLKDNMTEYDNLIHFDRFGDFDSVVHDFARISFAFLGKEVLFENPLLFEDVEIEGSMVNTSFVDESNQETESDQKESSKPNSDIPTYTEEEKEEMKKADWRGVPLATIIEAWVKYRGKPGPNEVHNYYNEMVKYFRNIMGNNKRLVFYLLPRFGHSEEECWSQVKSICRVNTLSTLDKEFYFFLKNNGFYVSTRKSSLDEYMLSDDEVSLIDNMPTPPPVFREFLKSAPVDFRAPMVNALMPILGTLTSYLGARYPYDDRIHTTSFFSVIYAPPSSGKGFVDRLMFLFDDLKLRDEVQNAREMIYLRTISRKGDNEKAPEMPHTSLRIIPTKNSETEFLQKQQDNHGYHMFTFAAEMDSWAKGEKAAGGNKSDMIRIAWDNGEYGQQFKSANTFKGMVKLYWNVLITGTQNQLERYFKDVENGLVTRCSFTEIENQEFKLAKQWKPIPAKSLNLIRNFMRRCDENTYETPCTVTFEELSSTDDESFDKEIDWRFVFRDRKIVDLSWIMPVIDNFQQEQCNIGMLAIDKARDAFRRRVGVRGFRLALLCTALYPSLNSRAIETIKNFVDWWMHVDIENMLRLWGQKYNEQNTHVPNLYNINVFNSLKDEFSKTELLVVMKQQQVKSKVANVIWQWSKAGFIEKLGNDRYKKITKK